MKTNRRALIGSLFAAFASLSLSGCDCGGPRSNLGTDAQKDAGREDAGLILLDAGERDGSADAIIAADEPVALHLGPDDAQLALVLGASAGRSLAFLADVEYASGSVQRNIDVAFSLSSRLVGEIDPDTGVFNANARFAGVVTVRAEMRTNPAIFDEVQLTVRLSSDGPSDMVPADIRTLFETATIETSSSAQALVYPLDQAVMPQNVFPPDVQWTSTPSQGWVRMRMRKPNVEATAYVQDTGTHHWQVPRDLWNLVVQSDPGAPIEVIFEHLDGNRVVARDPIRINVAAAALSGSVYYWSIAEGKILRINDGEGTRQEFMGLPERAPSNFDQSRCVGCHSVSPSGRYMVGRIGGGQNKALVFDLTNANLAASPAPSIFPMGQEAPTITFSTWSPDESLIATTNDIGGDFPLRLYNPMTGNVVPHSGTAPSRVTQPAWSPDGTAIAYVDDPNEWGANFTRGHVAVVDIQGTTFGASTRIHDAQAMSGDFPDGNADSYPTWSPDSRRLAFGHGAGSCSDPSICGQGANAALYIMNRDGSDVVRLSRGCGGDRTDNNYQPRFSPFQQGGYYWLSFLSRRDYGNPQVGSSNQRQQIWVMAIKVNPAPGEDPSSVPYWLPGQSPTAQNIAAFWAPRACREDGDSCSTGSECCGGECIPGDGGALVCSPPPPVRCRQAGQTCSTTADCCNQSPALMCTDNVCQAEIL